jgi:hypothetical protein
MSMNRWYSQFMILFGSIMTIFYVGIGLYFIFSDNLTHIDKFIRYLVGGTFVFYGIYRLYGLSVKIKDEFFSDKYNNE